MIVPMKHITLFARKADERRIMKALQENGVIQIQASSAELEGESSESAAGLFRSACETELSDRQGEVATIKAALGRLNPYLPKAGLLDAPPECAEDELTGSVPGALSICGELDALIKQQAAVKAEREKKVSPVKDAPSV